VPFARGCAFLAEGEARLLDADGSVRTLAPAVALGEEDGLLLVADAEHVRAFDAPGHAIDEAPVEAGVTAVGRADGRLVTGSKRGVITVAGRATVFTGASASEVVRIRPGPSRTLLVGFADGDMGIWHLDSGARLGGVRLHGPAVHLRVLGDRVIAASELGDTTSLDLGVFSLDYCRVLDDVWRAVPVVWEGGRAVVREVPRAHRCLER
jgi:hypothetical protein